MHGSEPRRSLGCLLVIGSLFAFRLTGRTSPVLGAVLLGLAVSGFVIYRWPDATEWANLRNPAWWRERFSVRFRLAEALLVFALLSAWAAILSVWIGPREPWLLPLFFGFSALPVLACVYRELRFLTRWGVEKPVLRVQLILAAFFFIPAVLCLPTGVVLTGLRLLERSEEMLRFGRVGPGPWMILAGGLAIWIYNRGRRQAGARFED